jgi:photosystem II oxygen-evolving enhancer protein 2
MVRVIVDTNDSDQSTTVVLRDLVYETENVSLMIAPFDRADHIQDMGSPEEVGQRVAAKILAPEGSGRTATLLSTSQIEDQGQVYYLFEYETRLGSQKRHETVGITIFRHRLYTLTASTIESRWSKVKNSFYGVAQSLRVG